MDSRYREQDAAAMVAHYGGRGVARELGLLDDAFVAERAKARGVTEKEYMRGNLLGREVTAADVAQAFLAQAFLAQALALKTTADVMTVDGGNIAAALR